MTKKKAIKEETPLDSEQIYAIKARQTIEESGIELEGSTKAMEPKKQTEEEMVDTIYPNLSLTSYRWITKNDLIERIIAMYGISMEASEEEQEQFNRRVFKALSKKDKSWLWCKVRAYETEFKDMLQVLFKAKVFK